MAKRTRKTPSALPSLVLPAELTIYTAAQTHAQWLAWLGQLPAAGDEPAAAELQAEAVDQVDAAGVQLLLCLQQSLSAQGRRCRLRGASPVLEAGCAGLGLAGWLAELNAAEGRA